MRFMPRVDYNKAGFVEFDKEFKTRYTSIMNVPAAYTRIDETEDVRENPGGPSALQIVAEHRDLLKKIETLKYDVTVEHEAGKLSKMFSDLGVLYGRVHLLRTQNDLSRADAVADAWGRFVEMSTELAND